MDLLEDVHTRKLPQEDSLLNEYNVFEDKYVRPKLHGAMKHSAVDGHIELITKNENYVFTS